MADDDGTSQTLPSAEEPRGAERPTMAVTALLEHDDQVTLDVLRSEKRYEMGGMLGEGGMGEVRLRTDLRIA